MPGSKLYINIYIYIGDGLPTFNDENPYNGYINPYYRVDDHPLLYGNTGSLDHMNKGHWMGKHSHPGICQCAKG